MAISTKIRTKAQTVLWGEENTGKLEMINIREYYRQLHQRFWNVDRMDKYITCKLMEEETKNLNMSYITMKETKVVVKTFLQKVYWIYNLISSINKLQEK